MNRTSVAVVYHSADWMVLVESGWFTFEVNAVTNVATMLRSGS